MLHYLHKDRAPGSFLPTDVIASGAVIAALLSVACTAPTPIDTADTGPLSLSLPCPTDQTLTLPRMGALQSVTLDGGYAWGWLTGESLTVPCGAGGELEVQWTM